MNSSTKVLFTNDPVQSSWALHKSDLQKRTASRGYTVDQQEFVETQARDLFFNAMERARNSADGYGTRVAVVSGKSEIKSFSTKDDEVTLYSSVYGPSSTIMDHEKLGPFTVPNTKRSPSVSSSAARTTAPSTEDSEFGFQKGFLSRKGF
ncbi:hypothetical protein P7C73_g5060, partial [Tremellales sp. Uapishka_1]